MIGAARILGLIPARGGSKGIPGKNLAELGGKPLLAWTIAAARASRYLDRVVLSSEDPAILEAGKRHGCDVPFRRPAELARDESSSADVAAHALEQLPGYDYLVLLQPTSPLRTAGDIDACIELCHSRRVSSCVSVRRAQESPELMYRVQGDGAMQPLLAREATRRQEHEAYYLLNGAVYVVRVADFMASRRFILADTMAHEMPASRSLDIDVPEDLEQARLVVARGAR